MSISCLICGDVYFNPQNSVRVVSIDKQCERIIKSVDYLCYNIEAPVKGDAKKIDKIGPSLFQDDKKLRAILDDNVICNLANNHIMDYGVVGLQNTIEFCENRCIGAGFLQEDIYKPFIANKDDVNVAFFSLAEAGFGVENENEPGYAWFREENVLKRINELKKDNDFVVLIVHAGLENVNLPLPEVRKIYRQFIDNGCDLVIAHHPHVIQGSEIYKEKYIFYSLGNFMFDKVDANTDVNGKSIAIKAIFNKNQYLIEIIPFEYKNNKLIVNQESNKLYDEASKLLNSDEYEKKINQICYNMYENLYIDYYRQIFGIHSLRGRVKNLFCAILNKSVKIDKMLYHNLKIETHYWTVLRGLEVKRGEENEQANNK